MIAEFGQNAVLRRPTTTGPANNPVAGAPVDYNVKIVVLEFSRGEVDGTRVLVTDKKVLLAKGALTIDPLTSDKLLIGGIPHTIVPPLEPLSPGGTVVMWTIQARR